MFFAEGCLVNRELSVINVLVEKQKNYGLLIIKIPETIKRFGISLIDLRRIQT